MTFYIGCHISASGGYAAMRQRIEGLGGNTFAFFTRNPRSGKALALDREDAAGFAAVQAAGELGMVVAHAPYTMNPCAARDDLRDYAAEMFADDLQRMELTPGNCYNFHPGAHVGQGAEAGVRLTATMLNRCLQPQQATTVLIETMAGKGTEIGRSFEEVAAIIAQVELRDKVGVCLDTCHIWDAGYDWVHDTDAVLDEFDRVIGLGRLKAIHLNDSKNPCGAHKDRHEKLGQGCIGAAGQELYDDPLQPFVQLLKRPECAGLPFVLETPNDDAGWTAEIAALFERAHA